MLLFLISFIMVFVSSYLIVSMLKPKSNTIGFVYMMLTMFAQMILTFEILSLFTAINKVCVLGMNIVFLISSFVIFKILKISFWKWKKTNLLKRILNSLKLDKSLMVLGICFCVFILVSFTLCATMPVLNGDALCYHLSRCVFWISQGSLRHFIIADIRNNCMPINSELLYTWILVFLRKDIGIFFVSFFGYILSIVVIFNLLGLIGGYCYRKRLWVIFLLSSIPSVLVQASTTETDIIIAGLILSSFYLFWCGLKNNEKIPIFMASLAYAIAIGTKTTSFFMIPGIGMFMLFLCWKFDKKFKFFVQFLIFGIFNFLVFSSFNYILNYIEYSNFMSANTYVAINQNFLGWKSYFSNFIKHIISFIDFSGFKWGFYLRNYVQNFQDVVLSFFHLSEVSDGVCTISKLERSYYLVDSNIGSGILGFILYLPCCIIAMLKIRLESIKKIYLFIFGFIFFLNLMVMSIIINYSIFDLRYIVAFLVLSSPVLIYSYGIKFKPFKYIVILFAMFYLCFMSVFLCERPFVDVFKFNSVSKLRKYEVNKHENYFIKFLIKRRLTTDNKILIFGDRLFGNYIIKSLALEGYNIDFEKMNTFDYRKLPQYNVVIVLNNTQIVDLINEFSYGKYIPRELKCSVDYNVEGYNYPTVYQCFLSENFWLKNHFSMKQFDIKLKNKKNRYKIAYFYNNLKNPPKYKH